MGAVGDQYERRARVIRLVDGDTLDLEVDLGFKMSHQIRARLYGVDTPEVYGVKRGSEEYTLGKEASAFAERWIIENAEHVEKEIAPQVDATLMYVTVRSYDAGKKSRGKYGRWLIEVFPGDGEGMSLNQALLEAGLAEEA